MAIGLRKFIYIPLWFEIRVQSYNICRLQTRIKGQDFNKRHDKMPNIKDTTQSFCQQTKYQTITKTI